MPKTAMALTHAVVTSIALSFKEYKLIAPSVSPNSMIWGLMRVNRSFTGDSCLRGCPYSDFIGWTGGLDTTPYVTSRTPDVRRCL